jgi:hypothetical protein
MIEMLLDQSVPELRDSLQFPLNLDRVFEKSAPKRFREFALADATEAVSRHAGLERQGIIVGPRESRRVASRPRVFASSNEMRDQAV